jgi:hypothetical protein
MSKLNPSLEMASDLLFEITHLIEFSSESERTAMIEAATLNLKREEELVKQTLRIRTFKNKMFSNRNSIFYSKTEKNIQPCFFSSPSDWKFQGKFI